MNENAHDLVGAYALGGLSDDEAAEFEVHLVGCDACRDELASLSVVLEALAEPGAEEEVAPVPAGLAARIGAALAVTPQDPGLTAFTPMRLSPATVAAQSRRRFAPRLLATAAAVAALAIVSLGLVLQRAGDNVVASDVDLIRGASDVIEVPLGLGDAVAYVSPTEGVAVTGSTPKLPTGQQYQMWVVPLDGSAPIAGPTMDGGAVTAAWVTSLDGAAAIAVSVEPTGGSASPTEVVTSVNL